MAERGTVATVTGATTFLAMLERVLSKAGIPHMVAGSFASAVHGSPRTTQDIDVVVDPTFASLDKLLELLAREPVYCDAETARAEFRKRGQFNVIDSQSGWKADLIVRKARPFSVSELERCRPIEILGVTVPVASAEDTVLAKLEWAKLGESERQLRDVRGILEVNGASLDRAYIERWLDDLEVRSLWEAL